MLNFDGENGQIIKLDSASSFLAIREAFVFKERQADGSFIEKVVGKIMLSFRTYDKNKPAGHKITQKVDFYLDSEDAAYLAEIMKTGRIREHCMQARRKAEESGKGTAYAFGYIKYGGSASCKLSRQLKFQVSDDGKLIARAMEGPGIVESKGQIKPAYKDSEAANKVYFALSEEECKKTGLAIERALRMLDIWAALGTVKENVAKLRERRLADEDQIVELGN